MTAPVENKQEVPQEQQRNDKEYNFRMLEAKYQRELAQERAARLEAEKAKLEAEKSRQQPQDEDDDDEPYVQKKKLAQKFAQHGQSTQSEIQKAMEIAKQQAKEEVKQEMWLENNPDFYDILQHAEKFAQKAPQLAETILRMPEGFERQKLVYNNIKALGIDKPEQSKSTIQDKVDANRKGPYYQPSNVGNTPYAATGDFSQAGQKNAYDKMQELKNRLRLG